MRATKATVPDIIARLPEWLRGQKRLADGVVNMDERVSSRCDSRVYARPAADLSSLPRLDVLKVDLDGADCDLAALSQPESKTMRNGVSSPATAEIS